MKRSLVGMGCLFIAVALLTVASGPALAKSLTVGVSWSNFQEERWKTDEAAMKNQLKKLGAKYISADAQTDSTKQIADVENLIKPADRHKRHAHSNRHNNVIPTYSRSLRRLSR